MEVKIWDGGLQVQEVAAIQKLQETFSVSAPTKKPNTRGGSLKDQLRSSFQGHEMFPWKGYAGFRFVNSKGRDGEYDLVIVTHCNVIIVELKDWNHEPVTAKGDIWYKGGKNMGRSPVSVTRNKKFALDNKMKKVRSQFTNNGFLPIVEFFVVMTGNANFGQLPEDQLAHTISLKEFLKFKDNNHFNKTFRPHPNSRVLNQDFAVFDEMFGTKYTVPKPIRVSGYEATEKIFEHPQYVYEEYLAKSEISNNSEALLRVWNFQNIEGVKAYTPEGRAEIVSREREVLQLINHQNRELYNHCLRSLTSVQKDEVTTHYSEVYELPPGHSRFNEFIGKFGANFSFGDRLTIVKILIAKFSDLHELKIAHRDIADHSLWIAPSKEVALSNFISAYHLPLGTVGDYRKSIAVGAVEAKSLIERQNLTPFQQDVHALAIVSWHLLSAKRMTPKSLESMQDEILAADEWYVAVLLDGLAGKFDTATQLFDALKAAEPASETLPTFNEEELERYRQSINHSRQYREDGDFIVETSEKEVYCSEGRLVKAWLGVGAVGGDALSNFHALSFLKTLDKISSVNPLFIPTIREYGIASKSGSLFLVTDQIGGSTWDKAEISHENRFEYIKKLVSSVESLHELGLAHGDIHPANVMLENDTKNIYLIDIPDYCPSEDGPKNHRYSPENIDSCTASERDNFAVMRMCYELLGMEWSTESEEYPRIADAIQKELNDPEYGFRDLSRFKKAIESHIADSNRTTLQLIVGGMDGPVTLYPDNGHLYVRVEENRNDDSEARITFTGVGGIFTAIYKKSTNVFVTGFSPRDRSSISRRDIESSHIEIDAVIRISPGLATELSELSEYMSSNDSFARAIESLSLKQIDETSAPLHEELKEAFEKLDKKAAETDSPPELDISTAQLWRAILSTETESYPNIEVSGRIAPNVSAENEVVIPYSSDIDPLGQYSKDDEIEALLVEREGDERKIGEVSLKKSALNSICLIKARSSAYSLSDGDTVYFRTRLDRASYSKRKAALERLLDKASVTPLLMDYFDPACQKTATDYEVMVTEDDFSRYDREDQYGNTISLNPQQRDAFSKLARYGPLSLLQGPPGTGKTEFIAAFVHFLIEKLETRRILLVSQSHEAVNTAAERIRSHCARLGTSLEVVRFSNRESAVSVGLKDVYSNALTSEKRELFNAECKHRVEALSDAIGLDSEFISSYVTAELRHFKAIDNLESLIFRTNEISDEEELSELKKTAKELDRSIRAELEEKYGLAVSPGARLSEAKDMLISKLCHEYGVKPNELRQVRALAKLSREMQDALSGDRVNYDEFFARSRQLVTGTCVGIGQRHIGIHENIYDWVIIDEAARSIASELAIALQSSKRVLLVGDHLQLPPLYSDSHKEALARRLGINSSRTSIDEVLRSDFARAFNSEYGKQASAALLTQYRMAPPIGNLVSETFYEGKLENGDRVIPNIYSKAPEALQSPVTWLDTSILGNKAHHLEDRGISIYNRCEADLIISLLKNLDQNIELIAELRELTSENEAAIGVICMYAEQKRILRQKFTQEAWGEGFSDMVKIDTVDSYQGKENRIIILSLTRSDKRARPGFLRAPNRINVAMSRAMDRLLIVGNAQMWKGNNSKLPLGRVVGFMGDHGGKAGYKIIPACQGAQQ